MTDEIHIEKQKATLKYCKECRTKTVHLSTKVFNEVDYVSNVTHKCLICGNVTKKMINHNDIDVMHTPEHKFCANCDKTIRGRGHKVDDSMGMSGDIYYFCDRKCANEYRW